MNSNENNKLELAQESLAYINSTNKIMNIKHIMLMLIPLLCCIILHISYMKIFTILEMQIQILFIAKYIVPIIVSLIVTIKFIRNNYDYKEKVNFKAVITCILSFVIAYGVVSLIVDYAFKNIKFNISTTILNYMIDGIEMLIIYFITKLLCQKEHINTKTVCLAIVVISIIEFIIRAKRVYLLLFFEEFGFSVLFILQIISILCSIFCMIVPTYAVSLYNEIKKDA